MRLKITNPSMTNAFEKFTESLLTYSDRMFQRMKSLPVQLLRKRTWACQSPAMESQCLLAIVPLNNEVVQALNKS